MASTPDFALLALRVYAIPGAIAPHARAALVPELLGLGPTASARTAGAA